ncbi:MAG: FliH/SctL family protein [Terracidiphilus sp.]
MSAAMGKLWQTMAAKGNHAGSMRGGGAGCEIEVLEYPACSGSPRLPAWDGFLEEVDEDLADEGGGAMERGAESGHGQGRGARGSAAGGVGAGRAAEEAGRRFEAGRERGRQEGQQAEREAQAAALRLEEERRKRQLAGVIASFAEERDRFLHAAEQEVVKLALAVAARILRREAQMDPLLLTGAVRVALGQLAAKSEVRLTVPAADVELWTETIALLPNLTLKPTVAAGEGMRVGDCVMESRMGTVDLGVRSQLGEIERGFFDRAGASGAARADKAAQLDLAEAHAAGGEAQR